jgi:CMP-N-acetylneuraminic acid synthetase
VLEGRGVLAVVPARAGSRGIPGKNMSVLRGTSLIGWAGRVLASLPFVDRRIISTDSPEYAAEGRSFGLDAPFLRPAHLSSDVAGAVEMLQHAVTSVEAADGRRYDVVLLLEPTSPLRRPEDVERAARRLVASGADAVVTVSRLSSQAHPRKILTLDAADRLGFYDESGRRVTRRQSLEALFWRNGVCYALTRGCVVERAAIFGEHTLGLVIDRPLANVDEPSDLEWAAFLLERDPVLCRLA